MLGRWGEQAMVPGHWTSAKMLMPEYGTIEAELMDHVGPHNVTVKTLSVGCTAYEKALAYW